MYNAIAYLHTLSSTSKFKYNNVDYWFFKYFGQLDCRFNLVYPTSRIELFYFIFQSTGFHIIYNIITI